VKRRCEEKTQLSAAAIKKPRGLLNYKELLDFKNQMIPEPFSVPSISAGMACSDIP
jgi:hypothetical protein